MCCSTLVCCALVCCALVVALLFALVLLNVCFFCCWDCWNYNDEDDLTFSMSLLLKLWRRYSRFQTSVRRGRDTDEPPVMQWKDLPQLDQWDAWCTDFEQLQIRAFKAASLGPMATVRYVGL